MGKATLAIFEELAAQDELTRRIHTSMMDFLRQANAYGQLFDARTLAMRQMVLQGQG